MQSNVSCLLTSMVGLNAGMTAKLAENTFNENFLIAFERRINMALLGWIAFSLAPIFYPKVLTHPIGLIFVVFVWAINILVVKTIIDVSRKKW